MGTPPLVIGSAQGRPMPTLPTTEIGLRRLGSAALGGGAVVLVLAATGVAVVLEGTAPVTALIAVALLIACAAPMILTGRRVLRAVHAAQGGPVHIAPPYAFRVEKDEIIFPPWYRGRGEVWLLSQTTLRSRRTRRGAVLEMRAPQRRPRRFSQSALALPVEDVIAQVEARR
ncbi:hypothetical protein [Brachybacterium phenoliresistens]|nr:hypothetical protein [Brachybacterium phenoliresistens]